MEMRQLKYFISAATHLNFTKAARACFVVQTAMTQQIANLEKELDVKLFERQSRGLALTPAGEAFLQEAREIVARVQRAQERMAAQKDDYTALLRVGHHGEMFRWDLVEVLRRLRREQSGVKVILYQLSRAELLSGLRDGQLDVCLMPYADTFQKDQNWMDWKVLEEDDGMLAVSADDPLAERKEITMAEVNELPRIGLWEYPQTVPGEVPPKVYGNGRDYTSVEVLIESGYCVGILPERMCGKGLYPGLRFLKIVDLPEKIRPTMAWRKGALSPEREIFCGLMEEQFRSGWR